MPRDLRLFQKEAEGAQQDLLRRHFHRRGMQRLGKLCFQEILEQIENVVVMIIKGIARQAALFHDVPHRDPIHGLFQQKRVQRFLNKPPCDLLLHSGTSLRRET